MFLKKATNIMKNKTWAPTHIMMREKIARVQEKAELERVNEEQREHERKKEREIKYYQELQEQAGGEKKKERVDWMYEYGGVRKQAEVGLEMVSADKPTNTPQALEKPVEEKANKRLLAVDLENKIREDPMMAMQAARMQALQEKLNDPMWALALNQKRKKKHESSKKKEKKERKHRRRDSTDSTTTRRVKRIRREEDEEHKTANSYSKYNRRRPELTEGEKRQRLRDMESDARSWEREKRSKIDTAGRRDRREEEENKTGGASYMREVNKQMMGRSLEERIRTSKNRLVRDDDFCTMCH